MQGRYTIRALSWDELAVRSKLQVKGRRLKELMNGTGYYKCKACQRASIDRKQADTRKAFATEYLNWPEWRIKLIYFSDEVHFQKASRKAEWIVRDRQERYSGDCIQKKFKLGPSELHCWSMVAYGYKGPLIFYGDGKGEKGQMTMEVYRNRILPLVVERRDELRKQGIEMIYQEDNDGSHGTRSQENIALLYKVKNDLNFIEDWPPRSPDLNAIETVWRILKQQVKLYATLTVAGLKAAVLTEWDALTISEVNACILGTKDKGSMLQDHHWHKRLQAVRNMNGLATKY